MNYLFKQFTIGDLKLLVFKRNVINVPYNVMCLVKRAIRLLIITYCLQHE